MDALIHVPQATRVGKTGFPVIGRDNDLLLGFAKYVADGFQTLVLTNEF